MVCVEKACTSKVRAHWKKVVECVEVTIVNLNYTVCLGLMAQEREAHNHQVFLLDAIPKIIKIHRSTTVAEVMRAVAHNHTQTITYRAAHCVYALCGVTRQLWEPYR